MACDEGQKHPKEFMRDVCLRLPTNLSQMKKDEFFSNINVIFQGSENLEIPYVLYKNNMFCDAGRINVSLGDTIKSFFRKILDNDYVNTYKGYVVMGFSHHDAFNKYIIEDVVSKRNLLEMHMMGGGLKISDILEEYICDNDVSNRTFRVEIVIGEIDRKTRDIESYMRDSDDEGVIANYFADEA